MAGPVVRTVIEDGHVLREVDLDAVTDRWPALREAPFSTLIIAEMIVRTASDPDAEMSRLLARSGDIGFRPARILMQDYAGLPALLDIAALRDTVAAAGRDPKDVRLSRPVHLVVDHSVTVQSNGDDAELANLTHEYANNAERFAFLKWADQAFCELTVVPPGMGIVHQMNLERFAEPIRSADGWIGPDTLLGTDSHSTMCGGLGIVGWGVGGIEATATLLDLPVAIPAPVVTAVRLAGQLRPGIQATDLALTLTRFLRETGVVGEIVEFTGEGAAALSVPDRATVSNMAPEYGATAAIFPFDATTARYLDEQGRTDAANRLRAYLDRQPILTAARRVGYGRVLEFDLASVGLTIAGPRLPHQTLAAAEVPNRFAAEADADGLRSGDIVLAAITSCTITSNPTAIMTAALLAKAALARGMRVAPHVKASFSPGARSVTDYLARLGLLEPLADIGFPVVGYGCMTCVGNSGDLLAGIEAEILRGELDVCAVLSGNRNFEARIHPAVKSNYLMSPALVVACAIAGHMRADVETAPIGHDARGEPVRLCDLWPRPAEVAGLVARIAQPASDSPSQRRALAVWAEVQGNAGPRFAWPADSEFFKSPEPAAREDLSDILAPAFPLLHLGDAVTTDHISPVGRIAPDSPAGLHLAAAGIAADRFGTYGARRGNPVLMRKGTFANPRLENRLAARQGWWTRHFPDGTEMTIEDAAALYRASGIGTVIVAGANYGIGSARDWAAKGTAALGVRAVVARSFERIHRTNLALVGVLPVQADGLPDRLEGWRIAIPGPRDTLEPGGRVSLTLTPPTVGPALRIEGICRLDTAFEIECWRGEGMMALARSRALSAASR